MECEAKLGTSKISPELRAKEDELKTILRSDFTE
jgi:hypothetical protein